MKLPYFKIKDAFDEAKSSFSFGSGSDKLASTAKLLGKTVANVGMLATEAGVEIIKRAPEAIGKMASKNLESHSHLMSVDQQQKAREAVTYGEAARERRLEKERKAEDQ